MRILVMGHKGMLGSDLMDVLGRDHEVSGVDVGEFDITSAPDCLRVVGDFRPGVIVNAAAYTDVDGCETNRDACFAVNAEGVRNLACACKDSGAKIVHYSTDYVFDGTKGKPYLEDDPCRPINAYGESKRKGEQVLIETAENHVLIRTAWLYGRRGRTSSRPFWQSQGRRDAAGCRRPGGFSHLQLRSCPGNKSAGRTRVPGHLPRHEPGRLQLVPVRGKDSRICPGLRRDRGAHPVP